MIWDITPPLRPGIPVWPGDTEYSETRNWEISDECPVNVSYFTMSTHTGAHADAPFHYDAEGKPSGALDLEPYIGPCKVIHAMSAGDFIYPERIMAQVPTGCERVLIRTYFASPRDEWDENFSAIAAETIELLAANGCRLIGTDTPSLDPQESKTMDAHMAVKSHDMRILESLYLDEVPAGEYELIALPLKLANLDAAPVRAILRSL